MVGTLQEAFDVIEEVFQQYGERRYQKLTGFSSMEDTELREERGRVQAATELSRLLRDRLGYTVDD